MALRDDIIKLATDRPELRTHLVPLLRSAKEHPSEEARKKYLKEHPNADPKNHTVSDGGKEDSGGSSKMDKLKSFLSKASKDIATSITKAPEKVQRLVVDPAYRKAAISNMAGNIKASPKKLAKGIHKSAKKELHELKHAAKAGKKLFKKPPEKLDKEDKKALYAAGAYVVAGTVATIPPGGMLMAAGALGKSFGIHLATKMFHDLVDSGFIHYEWAHSISHALHHTTHILGSEKMTDEEALIEGLTMMVAETLEKGISEEDLQAILAGASKPEDA